MDGETVRVLATVQGSGAAVDSLVRASERLVGVAERLERPLTILLLSGGCCLVLVGLSHIISSVSGSSPRPKAPNTDDK